MTLIGSKVIRAGDRLAVWSADGKCKVYDGPKKVRLFMQKSERLRSYVADASQYLVVRKNDGTTEHYSGPCSMFPDPINDAGINVMTAVTVGPSEALVVSKAGNHPEATAPRTASSGHGIQVTDVKPAPITNAGGVTQRIVRGPCKFMPAADETVGDKLTEAIADHNSYLEVRRRDGTVSIIPGPSSAFIDPMTDEGIKVLRATLIDASQALVVNRQAPGATDPSAVRQRLVRGPARFIPAADEWVVQTLREYTADENSYMEVRKRAGPIEIIEGPAARFLDPVLDESISVRPATMIDASEALVVYQHSKQQTTGATGGASSVERRIVRGPARFIPAADEWVHGFEWSGMPKDGSKTSYQPRALKFDKLKVIPMTAYHNVSEVRTNDDTLITIKLMLFYELVDIEKMLDATADPIGDFINAASSDVIAFCSAVSYETFLNETCKLNELGSFGQLVSRAEAIGYKVTKVVFRGFQAGAKLQAMHDDAIQERTRLRLLEETQAQEERAADLRLASEQHRAAREAELQIEQARLAADISLSTQKAKLAEQALVDRAEQERKQLAHEAEVAELRAKGEAELALERQRVELEVARNEEQLRVMREMEKMSVDITKVLVSQHVQPDNLIRLETGAPGEGGKAAAAKDGKGLLGALQLNL